MRKTLKLVAIGVAGIVVLFAVLALVITFLAARKRTRIIDVKVAPVAFVEGAAALERGRYLYRSRGCMGCHGANGAGKELVNESSGLYIRSPNISPGPGSVVRGYAEVDWVRSIRHGISPKKHPIYLMPSADYNRITDPDFAALVAYVRSLPPVSGSEALIRLSWIVKVQYLLGETLEDVELIDHAKPSPSPVDEGVTVEHGRYVAYMCTGCHGEGFSGGKIHGAPPDWPYSANLTPGAGSVMARYDSLEKFESMLRTGKRPDGSDVNSAMPFKTLRELSATDVGAVYAFLKTLPARQAGGR